SRLKSRQWPLPRVDEVLILCEDGIQDVTIEHKPTGYVAITRINGHGHIVLTSSPVPADKILEILDRLELEPVRDSYILARRVTGGLQIIDHHRRPRACQLPRTEP